MFHGTPNKVFNFVPEEDVISSMPDNVITNILDRLPIQYAVRTDVLSKNWRFKWTLLTQLVFDDTFFECLLQPDDYYRNLNQPYKYNGRDISRLLLHLKGPITKFVLYIPYNNNNNNAQLMDVKDIYHWVLFVSRKGIKDFTILDKSTMTQFKLPTQLLSCTELKYLKLEKCCFPLSPGFSGFPNLFSLELDHVSFGSYMCGEFLVRCPLVEILKISMCGRIRALEMNEIAKLVKLKMLHLNLLMLDSLTLTTKSFADDGVETVPTVFLCLETLTLSNVHFDYDIIKSFVFQLIFGSPNLQTLEITATYKHNPPPQEYVTSYLLNGQLQLQNVVFGGFKGSEYELYLIKSLLACSPSLKKFSIGLNSSFMVGGADGKFMFANKPLKLYRASPVVEIDLY